MYQSFAQQIHFVSDFEIAYGDRRESSILIHRRAVERAKTYRMAEADVIDSLREVDDDRTFLHFGCTSLYQYALIELKLSEDVACNLIAIMRKSRTVPELAAAIREGKITASKARKIVSVINEKNKSAWLELASTSTSRVIEKAVATENPKLATIESLKYRSENRLELVLGVSEEWALLLKRVKDVVSQKSKSPAETEEALKLAMESFLRQEDPLEKAKRANARKAEGEKSAATREPGVDGEKSTEFGELSALGRIPRRSKHEFEQDVSNLEQQQHDGASAVFKLEHPHDRVSSSLKHEVALRDSAQCAVVAAGARCVQTRWLDVHHVIPRAEGGENALENLKTVCTSHHRMIHSDTSWKPQFV